jgi:tetratricopeptide (TPR) repeat protein
MPLQSSSRPLAEQAAQSAEAIIFELLGTPHPLELLSRLGVVWARLGSPERAQNAFSAATATLSGMLCDDTHGARLAIKNSCTLLATAIALSGKADQARQLIATTQCIDRDTVLQRVANRCIDAGHLHEALALTVAIHDPTTQGMVLEGLAKEADARRQFALRDQAIPRIRNPLRRADTLYHIARGRLENRAFAEAHALLREATQAVRATRKLPERTEWLIKLAAAQMEAQAPQNALPLLAEAERLLPKLEPYTRVRVGCQLVQDWARAGQHARAQQLLQQLTPLTKQVSTQARDFLHHFFTEAHASLGNYTQAEQSVRRIRDTSLRADAWLHLTRVLLEANRLSEAARIVRLAHEAALKAGRDGYLVVARLIEHEQYEMLTQLLVSQNWSRLKGSQAAILSRLIEKGQWSLAASYAPQVESKRERERVYLSLARDRVRQGDWGRAQEFLLQVESPLGRFWGYWSLAMERPAEAQSLIPTLESLVNRIEPPRARATALLGMAFTHIRLDKKAVANASLEQAATILASLQLWSVERAIYLSLLILGWARCELSHRATETLRSLVEDAELQRELGAPFTVRCLAELGSSQVVIAAAPTVEQLRGAEFGDQYAWASALLTIAEVSLGIPPSSDAEVFLSPLLSSFMTQLTGAEAFDPYNLTLPLFTGDTPDVDTQGRYPRNRDTCTHERAHEQPRDK